MLDRLVKRRRGVAVAACVAAVCCVALLIKPGLRKDYTLEAFVATGDESYAIFRRFMDEFVSNEFALVAVQTDNALSDESLEILSGLVEHLRALDAVERVTAVTELPKAVRWLWADKLTTHPLVERNLLSRDGRTAAILLQMAGERTKGSQRKRVVGELRRIVTAARQAHGQARIILAGPYVTLIDMYEYVDRDLVNFSAAAFALLGVMLWLIFRRPGPVVFAIGCGLAATFCGLAVGVVLDLSMSLIVQMIVLLVTVLTVANCVHLAVAADEDASQWTVSTLQPIHRTLDRMWKPCTAVILTTAAGFASVTISQITPVRTFGWLMVAGLLIGLVYSLATAPVLGSGRAAGRSFEVSTRLGRQLTAAASLSLRRPGTVVAAFAVVTAAIAAGIPLVGFESDFVRNFRPGSVVRLCYGSIEEHHTPLGSVEIVVRKADGGSILTPENLRRARELGDKIVVQYGHIIKKAMTLADMLTLGAEDLPTNRFMLQARLAAASSAMGEGALRNFLSADRTALRINLRATEGVTVQEKLRVCAGIERSAREVFGDGYDVTVTGLYAFYATLVGNLVRDQYRSFSLAVPAVFIVFAILMRSIRIAAIAMVPNLLPVAICLGTMAWLGIPINMTTMMMLSVVFGIAVDDTLHYLWRCRTEFAAYGRYEDAITASHRSVGRACLFTTIVIAGGFWILTLSQFLPTAYFGGLVGYTMLAALATDLLLLPVLILWLKPFGRETSGQVC